MNRYRKLSPIVWTAIFACVVLLGLSTESRAGVDAMTKEARETVEATKEYTTQQKQVFQQKVHEELLAIQKQIMALQNKSRDISTEARADLQQSINELEKKKETAKEKLATLRGATDEKWNAVKSGVDAALDEVKQSYRKALSHLP